MTEQFYAELRVPVTIEQETILDERKQTTIRTFKAKWPGQRVVETSVETSAMAEKYTADVAARVRSQAVTEIGQKLSNISEKQRPFYERWWKRTVEGADETAKTKNVLPSRVDAS